MLSMKMRPFEETNNVRFNYKEKIDFDFGGVTLNY